MKNIDYIINELLIYEKKWHYKDFKKFYKNEQDFKQTHKKIIKCNPRGLYTYVVDEFNEIINFSDLSDSNNIIILHETTDLLIKIGIFLQEQKITII